jgi:ubiquinone/menaquinone biosynthesis C-methylase UbiE
MHTDERGASSRPHRCPMWVHYLLASPIRRLMDSPEKLLGPFVRSGMKVLEPGCGFGFFTIPLARMVGPEGTVVCVDVEPEAIARLTRRAEKARLGERIVARACSPTDLGVSSHAGQIDLVVVAYALHELEDIPGFLAQAASALKPAGRMLVLEPKGHVAPEQFARELEECRGAGFRDVPLEGGPKGRLMALFERAG